MIVVYDMRQRPQFLHAVRQKHHGEQVVARNPKYVRDEEDIEARATMVYLTQPHATIQALYAAKGVDVLIGDTFKDAEPSSVPPPPSDAAMASELVVEPDSPDDDAGDEADEEDTAEDDDEDESSASGWRLKRAGSGWYRVVNADGEDVVDHAVRYQEGRQIIREANA